MHHETINDKKVQLRGLDQQTELFLFMDRCVFPFQMLKQLQGTQDW